MSGDYSRFANNPLRNYGGVLLQQGRPLTDSDWNDLVAQTNRRIQAGTLDTCDQVVVSSATPDAFLITGKGGELFIGPGRLYVDGLLADNHGVGAQNWEKALAESYGVGPIPYAKQPYPPVPPKDSGLPKSGDPMLVYLDVWQREVTQFEDPDLVDSALGVDTTTRLQTVWQVKLLEKMPKDFTCATPLDHVEAWTKETKPSGGRLSTATATFSDPDPCLVAPGGGYKGLENQLYRVEIHKGGKLGEATFKWSRDNASVATRVTQIINPSNPSDPSSIVVESVGKDSVLRFSEGDWIEITDDVRELSGSAGDLHRITSVEDATRTITLEKPLTGSTFPTNPRIRRWDQTHKIFDKDGNKYADLDDAPSDGTIIVPTGGLRLSLELGAVVWFDIDAPGNEFHIGDYWVFAARTNDPHLESLDKAPPRGIHHHYAKLAVYTPPATIEDCRPRRNDCCTAVVRPGQSIQKAIDSLPGAGGCVCLKPGIHTIPQAITIKRSNVKLTGESMGTIVRTAAAGAVLIIDSPGTGSIEGVEVSKLAFERTGLPGQILGIVSISGAKRSAILDCSVKASSPDQSIGIQVTDCDTVRVAHCRIESVATGLLASGKSSSNLLFEANVLDLSANTSGTPSMVSGIVVHDVPDSCRIDGNRLSGAWSGIVINDSMAGAPQAGGRNMIVTQNSVVCAAASATSGGSDPMLFGIDVATDSSIIAQNVVALPSGGAAHAGIRATGRDLNLTDNAIVPVDQSAKVGKGSVGIQIGYAGGKTLTEGVRAAGNVVNGCWKGIVVDTANDVLVESNTIDVGGDIAKGSDTAGISLTSSDDCQIQGNRIDGGETAISCSSGTMTRVSGNSIGNGGTGVSMGGKENAPMISQNRIQNMANSGVSCDGTTGRCDIVENRITSCGLATNPASGIVASNVEDLHIEANEVTDTGVAVKGDDLVKVAYGINGSSVTEARIEGNRIGYTDFVSHLKPGEHRALLMSGLDKTPPRTSISVLGNAFAGPGNSALVEFGQPSPKPLPGFERIFFSNNYCTHATLQSTPTGAATVKLVGSFATVMGNHIQATTKNFPSVDFGTMQGPFIGNVSNKTTRAATAFFPNPENGFNMLT